MANLETNCFDCGISSFDRFQDYFSLCDKHNDFSDNTVLICSSCRDIRLEKYFKVIRGQNVIQCFDCGLDYPLYGVSDRFCSSCLNKRQVLRHEKKL